MTLVDADDAPRRRLLAICRRPRLRVARGARRRFERHDYGQTAIAARLVADEPHGGRRAAVVSRARRAGAAAVRPARAAAARYALVWSLPERARATALLALAAGRLRGRRSTRPPASAAATSRSRSERAAWPLAVARAERWCGPGWVLLGDAAHVVHPLAGQGLNLGLADVAALARVHRRARALARPGRREAAAPLRARARRADAGDGRASPTACGACSPSPAPAARELRNRGLTLVDRLPPLEALAHRAGARLLSPKARHESQASRPFRAARRSRCCRARPRAFADEAAIRKNLAERLPSSRRSTRSRKTPIPGLYEVRIGTDIFYTDEQGNHIIQGSMIDTRDAQRTSPRRASTS